MNIYFAGSIRGGRGDGELYGELIAFLSQYGPVLTEHVGNDVLLRAEKMLSEKEIFARDMGWLSQADVLVAEVTTPSLGVGYELGIAQAMGKRVMCLFRPCPGRDLSAMVAGNNLFRVECYQNIDEACGLIDTFLSEGQVRPRS